jgi:hypothetical protein
VPEANPLTVVPVPEPVELMSPGIRVSIQVPEDGSPVRTTLPEGIEQSGCVIVPITGAGGMGGGGLIITDDDSAEVQPAEFVTVNVYEPVGIPENTKELPESFIAVPPGSLVIVQEPDGNPFSTTLPVETLQAGCVIRPGEGA